MPFFEKEFLDFFIELAPNNNKDWFDLHRKDLHLVFIQAISDLDEIRGWWWEQGKESDDYESIDDFVKEKFLSVAKKFKLNYVTD